MKQTSGTSPMAGCSSRRSSATPPTTAIGLRLPEQWKLLVARDDIDDHSQAAILGIHGARLYVLTLPASGRLDP